MEIKYYGHSCFVLTGNYSVCIDPYLDIGETLPKINSDYYFCSHNHFDHNGYTKDMGENIENTNLVKIINTFHDNFKGKLRGKNKVSIFCIQGIKIAHLGDLGEDKNLALIEQLKDVDVLLIPIGGNYTIDYKKSIDYISAIKPKIAIPMHYKFGESNIDIDNENEFVKEVKKLFVVEKVDKLSLCNINNQRTTVYVLKGEINGRK